MFLLNDQLSKLLIMNELPMCKELVHHMHS